MSRLSQRFADLSAQNRAALVVFTTAGDPSPTVSQAVLNGLPKAGADIIELGMPFTDAMADGPAIQEGSKRALAAGMTLKGVLEMVRNFRETDQATPIVLMGYYNPVYIYGPEKFAQDAAKAGVDGMIVVDLPPEEADELLAPLSRSGIDFIFLTAPTTDDDRLSVVLNKASGFVYYVSITGITGTVSASEAAVSEAVKRLKAQTQLPVAVGFGIKTPAQAAAVARHADAAVVGSAVVERVATGDVKRVHDFVAELANGVRGARGA